MWRQYIDRGDWNTTLAVTFKMCGLFVEVGRQFQVIFLIWVSFICLTVSTLTVEERLQALEAANVEIKEILVEKDERLKALEIEIQNLKSLNALNTEKEFENDDIVSNISLNNQPPGKELLFRTCHEIHLAYSSLTSGMHWIDPDGQGIGDSPIQVYCDMTTGVTSILHDSELPTNVGHCIDPGCYSKSIKYSATIRQINALTELSHQCHQKIKYDCNFAPFKINGVSYSWWNDKNGDPQYFWAGSNSSVHTCQCGIENNCIESVNKCNCDSNLPIPQFDSGLITNKSLLPFTRLNFGRTWLNISSGIYTLGRLECSGRATVNGRASSCADLWKIGHTLSGLYSVMGTQFVEAVYCDFTKLSSEPGFQTRIGDFDVKSLSTYFYVQRNSNFGTVNTPITYNNIRLNIGGAMDAATGIFTAPRTGSYFLTFSGVVARRSGWGGLVVGLKLNGNHIGRTRSDGNSEEYESISFQSTLYLKTGDRVWMEIEWLSSLLHFYANGGYSIHFTGWLLQEDIAQIYATTSL